MPYDAKDVNVLKYTGFKHEISFLPWIFFLQELL